MAVRIDKWLWAARFYKTRGLAVEAVKGGRVHVDGERVKPSKEIKPGDRIEVTIGQRRIVVDVIELSDRRGPASIAQTLYEETPESRAERERLAEERRIAAQHDNRVGGRPTKRDRRRIEAMRAGARRGGR